MAFTLTEEQLGLQDLLRKFFKAEITSEYLRSRLGKSESDAKLWEQILALGLFSYFGSDDPVARAGFRELSIIASEAGRALLPELLADSILFGPYLLQVLVKPESSSQLSSLLPADFSSNVCAGKQRIRCLEPELSTALQVEKENDRAFLTGQFRFVPALGAKDHLLLCAPGSGVFLGSKSIDQSSALIKSDPPIDQSIARSEVTLKRHEAVQLVGLDVDKVLALLKILRAAELAGLCARVIEMTRDYVVTRKQFGVPVGGFQAVQHKLVDIYLQSEALRAFCNFASWTVEHSPEQLRFVSKALLSFGCDVAPKVVEAALQLHGGIGFTWEYDLHLFLRRAKMYSLMYGLKQNDFEPFLELAAQMAQS